MKKLVLLLITLISVLFIGACNNAPEDTQVEETKNEFCIYGKNNRVDCYEYETEEEKEFIISFFNQVQAGDEFDKTKAPSYMIDELGNYVTTDTIGALLKSKYLDDTESHIYDNFDKIDDDGNSYWKFVLNYEPTDANDIYARMVLLLQELQLYTYYALSANNLIINVMWLDETNTANQIMLVIDSTTILNPDMFVLTPEILFNKTFENDLILSGATLDIEQVYTFYNEYVTNGTFDGYVLNY